MTCSPTQRARRLLRPLLASSAMVFSATLASAQAPTEAPPAAEPAATPAPTAAPAPAATPTPQPTPAPAPVAAPEPAAVAAPEPMPEPMPAPAEPAPAPEPAAAPVTLSPIVSMMTRLEVRHHYQDVGRNVTRWMNGDRTAYRARFGLQTNTIDVGNGYSVLAAIVPQSSGFIDTSGGVTDPGFDMHEGYLKISNGDTRFDIGRMELVYGDHLVIGNLGWHQTARSFDAMRLHMVPSDSGAWVDLFVSQVREGMSFADPTAPAPQPSGTFGGDQYFMGIYADLGKMVNGSMNLDTYLLSQVEPAYSTAGDIERSTGTRFTLGVRAKDKVGDLDYRVEAGAQFGAAPVLDGAQDVSRGAFQADGEAGYKVGDARIALEGFYASGDDKSTADADEGWVELYPTTHKWLGLTDVMGVRTNVMGGAAHLALGLSDRWKLNIDGHVFARPQESMTGLGNDGYAGSEVDTGLVYALGKGLNSRAMYGFFIPGDIYANDARPVHYLEVEMAYNYR